MDDNIKNLINTPLVSEDPMDLKEYWRIIERFKWRIFFFSFTVTILAIVFSFTLTPQYQSTVSLMIETEYAKTVSIDEIYGMNSDPRDYHMTQFQILKSRYLIEKVIEQLELLTKADFNQLRGQALAEQSSKKNNSEESSYELLKFLNPISPDEINEVSSEKSDRIISQKAVEIFSNKLTFEPVIGTRIVNISFDSSDPELAAEVVNAVAETYIQSYLESKLEKTAEAKTWMNARLSSIKEKLDLAEVNLQNFLKRENLVDVQGISSINTQDLDELNTQLRAAGRRVSQSKNIYDLSNAEGVTISQLVAIPAVLNHILVQQARIRVIEAESDFSLLSERYGPKHPKIIFSQKELESANDSFDSQVLKLVSTIATEYQTARTNERQLAQLVEQAKKEHQRLSFVNREFKNLQQEVEINRQLYTAFFTRLKETTEATDFPMANARIIDRAQVALWPYKPSKRKIVIFAFIGSLMIGVLLAFIHDLLSAGIRNLDDIEKRLRQRMLGLIPLQKLKKNQELPHDIFFDKNNRELSEAIRTIRTSLLMSQMDESKKVIAITSSIPAEGKSTLSINLAFALGQMERVLLIDADLRRPSLGKRFGYPAYQPGLSNLIANSASLSNCIVTDQKSNIDLMLAGAIPPNPQELLSSDLMKTALKLLSSKYDRIILDTAPTQAVSDSLVLSTYADTMIYVVKADSTHIKTIKRGIGRLLQIGCNVAGVVLNQVNTDESSKYDDYEGYYDSYGYNPEDAFAVESNKTTKKSSMAKCDDELVAPPEY
ncbi:MAG: polysaccharide biosynthesis tyrosine autokinase [Gammaproteobacteria bacterium]|nr:polysaccharide biosynthesis tyrosine autokinase [Gammaproteobacteria bacterium]